MDQVKTIEVVIEHDGEAWLAHLADNERAHTYGRTLAAARRNIAEVIEAWLEVEPGDYRTVETFENLGLVTQAVDAYTQARDDVAAAQARLNDAGHVAAEILVNKEGLSLRDAGDLLGLSFQRVHQLLNT
jgi:predicted RNase H-like HicB family nuclease